MRITLDPAKNARNVAERGLPFDLVAQLDWETTLAIDDRRKDYGEVCVRVLGLSAPDCTSPSCPIADVRFTSSNSARPTSVKKPSTQQGDDRPSRPDDDSPEWTAEDMRKARPALAVVEAVFGPDAADTIRRSAGPSLRASRKTTRILPLDPDVLDAYRREGPDWQTRMNDVLRRHMPRPRKEPV